MATSSTWKVFRPAAYLQHLIHDFWVFEQDFVGSVSHSHIALPSPTPAVMVPCATAVSAATAAEPSWQFRQVTNGRVDVHSGPTGGLFGISFQPTGFYQLFGLSVAAACEAGTTLPERAGSFLRSLAASVGRATSAAKCVDAAELLLLAERNRGEHAASMESFAASLLLRNSQVSVDELASQANLCRRQFERRFRAVVGASPKLFAEVSRFCHVMEQLSSPTLVNWQDVTHACGYFDQAHLIREFRRFTGETPALYMQHAHGHNAAAEANHK